MREGSYGSAWFAHRDETGSVTHVEIRGRAYRGSLRGGQKRLFRLSGGGQQGAIGIADGKPTGGGREAPTRLAVMEAPIDALSLAALEDIRSDTLYVATGGGMGPKTVQAIERLLAGMASLPHALLSSATDANSPGERYAARHAELAAAFGIRFERLAPIAGTDWNDVLRQRRRP